VYQTYVQFEKQQGSREGLEDVIMSKRRFQYEEDVKENPLNYDAWFDYLKLEEERGDVNKIREVYERAIANIPPVVEKRYWKRYIYLWINFAMFEELISKDVTRTRAVYKKCLEVIPHKIFSFSKIWIFAAEFEIREKNLTGARKILGEAIAKSKKEKIFKRYIDIEMAIGNVDRCRKLYEKYLEVMPSNCQAWAKFAEMESGLDEYERAGAIFELAVNQPVLDMPEVIWKAYIDMEIKQGQPKAIAVTEGESAFDIKQKQEKEIKRRLTSHQRVRYLYKRLLQRTKHVKVWISRAQFEASIKDLAQARAVFEEADAYFKGKEEQREERKILLEAYRDFERVYGDKESVSKLDGRMPNRVKKKRQLTTEDGTVTGVEEYFHYLFPDEQQASGSLKLLEMAKKWKKAKTTAS